MQTDDFICVILTRVHNISGFASNFRPTDWTTFLLYKVVLVILYFVDYFPI